MKLLTWVVFVLCALVWTGSAWVVAAALQWGLGLLGSGQVLDVGKALASMPLQAWLTQWIRPGDLSALLSTVVQALDGLQQAWPGVGAALQWLVPAVWVVSSLGVLLLLAAAAGLHLLLGKTNSSGAAQARAPG